MDSDSHRNHSLIPENSHWKQHKTNAYLRLYGQSTLIANSRATWISRPADSCGPSWSPGPFPSLRLRLLIHDPSSSSSPSSTVISTKQQPNEPVTRTRGRWCGRREENQKTVTVRLDSFLRKRPGQLSCEAWTFALDATHSSASTKEAMQRKAALDTWQTTHLLVWWNLQSISSQQSVRGAELVAFSGRWVIMQGKQGQVEKWNQTTNHKDKKDHRSHSKISPSSGANFAQGRRRRRSRIWKKVINDHSF